MPKVRNSEADKMIGARIKTLRKRRKLTQVQLGDALGVSYQQIQKFENGTNSITFSKLSNLCLALKITPNELFCVFNIEQSLSLSNLTIKE